MKETVFDNSFRSQRIARELSTLPPKSGECMNFPQDFPDYLVSSFCTSFIFWVLHLMKETWVKHRPTQHLLSRVFEFSCCTWCQWHRYAGVTIGVKNVADLSSILQDIASCTGRVDVLKFGDVSSPTLEFALQLRILRNFLRMWSVDCLSHCRFNKLLQATHLSSVCVMMEITRIIYIRTTYNQTRRYQS